MIGPEHRSPFNSNQQNKKTEEAIKQQITNHQYLSFIEHNSEDENSEQKNIHSLIQSELVPDNRTKEIANNSKIVLNRSSVDDIPTESKILQTVRSKLTKENYTNKTKTAIFAFSKITDSANSIVVKIMITAVPLGKFLISAFGIIGGPIAIIAIAIIAIKVLLIIRNTPGSLKKQFAHINYSNHSPTEKERLYNKCIRKNRLRLIVFAVTADVKQLWGQFVRESEVVNKNNIKNISNNSLIILPIPDKIADKLIGKIKTSNSLFAIIKQYWSTFGILRIINYVMNCLVFVYSICTFLNITGILNITQFTLSNSLQALELTIDNNVMMLFSITILVCYILNSYRKFRNNPTNRKLNSLLYDKPDGYIQESNKELLAVACNVYGNYRILPNQLKDLELLDLKEILNQIIQNKKQKVEKEVSKYSTKKSNKISYKFIKKQVEEYKTNLPYQPYLSFKKIYKLLLAIKKLKLVKNNYQKIYLHLRDNDYLSKKIKSLERKPNSSKRFDSPKLLKKELLRLLIEELQQTLSNPSVFTFEDHLNFTTSRTKYIDKISGMLETTFITSYIKEYNNNDICVTEQMKEYHNKNQSKIFKTTDFFNKDAIAEDKLSLIDSINEIQYSSY